MDSVNTSVSLAKMMAHAAPETAVWRKTVMNNWEWETGQTTRVGEADIEKKGKTHTNRKGGEGEGVTDRQRQTETETDTHTDRDGDNNDDDKDCFYKSLFSALEQTHCARMWFYMLFTARFWRSTPGSGVLTALAWLVPHETAAITAQVLCTPYNHVLCHFIQSHIRKVHACLAAATCTSGRMTGIFYVLLR